MKKRLWSILLTACLLVGLLPTVALAEDASSDGTEVDPSAYITRAQLAEMIYANATLKTQIDLAAAEGTDPSFIDLTSCTEAQKTAIKALYRAKVISGTSETKFDPGDHVTRAEAVVVIWRAAGSRSNTTKMTASFQDMSQGDWYAAAVNCFFGAGMLQGTSNGTFDGGSDIPVIGVNAFLTAYDTKYEKFIANTESGAVTRAELAEQFYDSFYPVLSKITPQKSDMPFTDISGCTDKQKQAIQFFYSLDIINGANETTFAPYAPASNFQMAALLQRCAEKQVPEEEQETVPADGEVVTMALLHQDALSGAFAFLNSNGVTDASVQAANDNPDAPGLKANLVTWNNGLKPATPTFSPAEGTYAEEQSITITAPEGAAIYYTVDGTDPTTGSTLYKEPISISETTTLKAIAVKNNLISDVAEAPHIITLNANGGVCGIASLTTNEGGKLTSLPTASRESYSFDGWYTAADGGTQVTTETVFNANTTIYAHWTSDGGDAALTYSISLDVSGTHTFVPADVGYGAQTSRNVTVRNTGTGATGDLSVTLSGTNANAFTVSTAKISSIAPGGTDSFTVVPNTGLPASTYTATVTVNGDSVDAKSFAKSFAVSFTVNAATEYTITFDGNGGTLSATSMTTTGQKLASLPDPPRNGYIFDGWFTAVTGGDRVTAATVFSGNTTIYAHWTAVSSGGSSSGGGSSSSSSGTTTKNPDGSTTTTVTDKTTGTVTETTKNTDGSTTTVETKKDGTVTETVKTADGTTGTVVTDKDGNVTEAKANVSTAAAKEAAKTGEAVTLPVEVPAAKTTGDAPAVEITLSKSSGSLKVEIPMEKTTPGTVAVIMKADGTEKIVSTSLVTESGIALTLTGSTTVKIIDNTKSFTDVSASNVFYKEVCSLSAREIMVGKSEEKFDLYSSVTLNQISNVAGRITGAVDVKDYSGGIAWGQANGLKTGNESATRGDMLKALYNAAGSPAVTDTSILAQFNDPISEDMKDISAWAAQNGILKGNIDSNGILTANLNTNVNRGQACALADRTLKSLG